MMMADKTIKKMAADDARKIVAGMFGCSNPREQWEREPEPKVKAGKISMAKARKIVENF